MQVVCRQQRMRSADIFQGRSGGVTSKEDEERHAAATLKLAELTNKSPTSQHACILPARLCIQGLCWPWVLQKMRKLRRRCMFRDLLHGLLLLLRLLLPAVQNQGKVASEGTEGTQAGGPWAGKEPGA